GVLLITLEESGEFLRRPGRREHRLLFEIFDELRLPIKLDELAVESLHDRARHKPHQPNGGKSIPASASVGISGNSVERRVAATASGLIFPVPRRPRKFPSPILATCNSPARSACAIGPPPRSRMPTVFTFQGRFIHFKNISGLEPGPSVP